MIDMNENDSQAPRHRFFVPELTAPISELRSAEAHHALHVLRLRAGARVELFDGKGRRADGVISAARRDSVEVSVETAEGPLPRSRPEIHLAFAAPKGNRLDWLLEKSAELGVASLQPIRTQRSVAEVRNAPAAMSRWTAICASAVRQSRQVYVPEILPAAELADVLADGPRGAGILAHGGAEVPPLAEVLGCLAGTVHILIGPEGGWTEEEIAAARQRGFCPARLGQTTLRVETAAVALVAAALALYRGS